MRRWLRLVAAVPAAAHAARRGVSAAGEKPPLHSAQARVQSGSVTGNSPLGSVLLVRLCLMIASRNIDSKRCVTQRTKGSEVVERLGVGGAVPAVGISRLQGSQKCCLSENVGKEPPLHSAQARVQSSGSRPTQGNPTLLARLRIASHDCTRKHRESEMCNTIRQGLRRLERLGGSAAVAVAALGRCRLHGWHGGAPRCDRRADRTRAAAHKVFLRSTGPAAAPLVLCQCAWPPPWAAIDSLRLDRAQGVRHKLPHGSAAAATAWRPSQPDRPRRRRCCRLGLTQPDERPPLRMPRHWKSPLHQSPFSRRLAYL